MKLFLSIMLVLQSLNLVGIIPQKYYRSATDKEAAELLRCFVRPGDIVFDVGAHEGEKTRLYLQQGASVICFEPQPACIETLRQRFKGDSRVVVEPIALGDVEGELVLYQASPNDVLSTFSQEWMRYGRFAGGTNWKYQTKVQVSTLDKMIAKYGVPQFCKIDVENYEFQVLKGLHYSIPYISFEFTTELIYQAKKCVDRLIELGYTSFNFCVGESCALWFDEWVPADRFYQELLRADTLDWGDLQLWGDIYASYKKEEKRR